MNRIRYCTKFYIQTFKFVLEINGNKIYQACIHVSLKKYKLYGYKNYQIANKYEFK